MGELGTGGLAGRGPVPLGLKDIGIREGTFTFGVVVADIGCGAVGVRREGGDDVGVGTAACVVGDGTDDPGTVDDPGVVWWGCGVSVEDSESCVPGVPGDNLRKAARAAASLGADGISWSL